MSCQENNIVDNNKLEGNQTMFHGNFKSNLKQEN
jgi:hypothetical protein